jgi:hypothetical protein
MSAFWPVDVDRSAGRTRRHRQPPPVAEPRHDRARRRVDRARIWAGGRSACRPMARRIAQRCRRSSMWPFQNAHDRRANPPRSPSPRPRRSRADVVDVGRPHRTLPTATGRSDESDPRSPGRDDIAVELQLDEHPAVVVWSRRSRAPQLAKGSRVREAPAGKRVRSGGSSSKVNDDMAASARALVVAAIAGPPVNHADCRRIAEGLIPHRGRASTRRRPRESPSRGGRLRAVAGSCAMSAAEDATQQRCWASGGPSAAPRPGALTWSYLLACYAEGRRARHSTPTLHLLPADQPAGP